MQGFTLGTLVREGLQHYSNTHYRLYAVPAAGVEAEAHLLARMSQDMHSASLLSTYRSEYGSFAAVLAEPACQQLVHLQTAGGQQYALLLVDRLARQMSGRVSAEMVTPHQALPLPVPLPVPLPLSARQGDGSAAASASAAAAAPSVDVLTAQLAALNVGSSLPPARLVTTAADAAAAVAELLQAPIVAVDSEGALERGGSIDLIQLYAPSSGGRCYIFDLHAMAPPARDAALGHLRGLLESADVTKVGQGRVLRHGQGGARPGARAAAGLMCPLAAAPPRFMHPTQHAPPAACLPCLACLPACPLCVPGHARLPRRLRGALLPPRHPRGAAVGHTGRLWPAAAAVQPGRRRGGRQRARGAQRHAGRPGPAAEPSQGMSCAVLRCAVLHFSVPCRAVLR